MISNNAYHLLVEVIRMHLEEGREADTNLIKSLKVYCENKDISLDGAKLRDVISYWINQGYSNDQIVEMMIKNQLDIEHTKIEIKQQTGEYLPFAYCTLAMIIKELSNIEKDLNTDIICNLVPNNLIIVGQSTNESRYHEHIVPRVYVRDQASKMFNDGDEIEDVVVMLEKNLKVVLITDDEQKHLDAMLKEKMPDGWNFGDSIFARLDAAGINWKPISIK